VKIKQLQPASKVKMVALVTAVCLLGDSMLYVVLPIYWKLFGLQSLWEVGLLLSINRFVRIPIHPLIGRYYQRFSIRSGLLISLLITILSTASYGLLSGFWLLLAARCLWGIAWALLKQGGQLTIVDCIAETGMASGRLMGLYHGLSRLGSLFGMFLGGFLMDGLGREYLCLGFAVAAVCTLPLIRFIISPDKIQQPSLAESRQRSSGQFKTLWILFITGYIVALIYQGLLTSTVSYWVSKQDLSSLIWLGGIGAGAWSSLFFTVRWVWDPFLAPWMGALTDRLRNRKSVLIYTALVAGVLFMLMPVSLQPYVWTLNLLLIMVSSTVFTTLKEAWFMEETSTYPDSKHKMISLYSMYTDLGAATGPVLAYLMISFIGDAIVCWIIALLLIVSATLWSYSKRKERTSAVFPPA
jgi:MFS family permease